MKVVHILQSLFLTTAVVLAAEETPNPSSDCALRCTREYAPVCGSDGQTYANECQLMTARCDHPSLQKASEGECPVVSLCDQILCPKIYMPVCGSDRHTYENQCVLAQASCKDPRIHKVGDGKCKKKKKHYHKHTKKPRTKVPKPPKTTQPTSDDATGCAAVSCPQYSHCVVDELTGKGYCADECAPERCPEPETQCELRSVACLVAPCPSVATCVPI